MNNLQITPVRTANRLAFLARWLLLGAGFAFVINGAEISQSATAAERALTKEQLEKERRTEWFRQAKYGIMFHFVPSMGRFKQIPWTAAEWNAKVDSADVKKVAQQAADIGAGYVIISLGQKGDYYCAPNPVYEKHWGFERGQFGSRRDLPMDLSVELKKRGIKMMLYVTGSPFASPGPASEKNGWHGQGRQFTRGETSLEGERLWLECLQWYSDHYGQAVAGWWVDGMKDFSPGYGKSIHEALRHGNPDAIITSSDYALSDFLHGHCTGNWEKQQQRLPTRGRLDETYGIQWHAFQYLGHSWAAKGTKHTTETVAHYATEVIKRGGVITFDIGTFDEQPEIKGPTLEIPEDQFRQLKAVRDAVATKEPRK